MTTVARDYIPDRQTQSVARDDQGTTIPPHPVGATGPGAEMPCHELLADLIPPLEDKDFQDLKRHIAAHGQKDPVVVHAGKILDGRSVYRACRELGLDPRTVPWDGQGSELEFILARNLHRRHLSTNQRAMIAAKVVRCRKALAAGEAKGTATGMPRANLPAGRERDRAAEEWNVSSRAVGDALVVAQKGVPELQQMVDEDAVKASAAAKVARLPPDEQRELVRQGPAAITEKGGQLRDTPPAEGPGAEPPAPAGAETCQAVEIKPRTKPDVLARKLISALGPERAARLRDALDRALAKMREQVTEHAGG